MKKIVERSREESEMREKKPSAHPSREKEKGLARPPRGALNQKGLRYQYPRGVYFYLEWAGSGTYVFPNLGDTWEHGKYSDFI